MHVVYISGTYMPACGGAEISMFGLMRGLVAHGFRLTVFTSLKVPPSLEYSHDAGIEVHRTNIQTLEYMLDDYFRTRQVDVILTQNIWADVALKFSLNHSIPCIYFARTAHGDLDISVGGAYQCTHVIANSRAVARFVKNRWNRDSSIIRSIVDLENYRTSNNSKLYITMVNPIVLKGGEIFREIVEALPERDFLAVQGWEHLRAGEEGWDTELFGEMASAFGTEPWFPDEVDLTDLKNLRCVGSTHDMRVVYSQTRVLLVPSIYAESSPRVILEAMINGIPVIGSRLGGITETLSKTGVIVSRFKEPAEWIKAICSLDDIVRYEEISRASSLYAESLDFSKEIDHCAKIIQEVITNPCVR